MRALGRRRRRRSYRDRHGRRHRRQVFHLADGNFVEFGEFVLHAAPLRFATAASGLLVPRSGGRHGLALRFRRRARSDPSSCFAASPEPGPRPPCASGCAREPSPETAPVRVRATPARLPARRPNHASGPANHAASFARVKVETRYTATITVVPVATIAPATFREFTSQLASTYPSVPPSRMVPAKIRHGAKLSAAHRLNVSSSDPITLTVPASTASDRIHFHASRKVKKRK